MMSNREEAFIRQFVDLFPVVRPVLAEHLEDNFGELLPRVFLADVMRRMVELDASEGDESVAPLLEHLEARFGTGDSDLDEMISTGFIEVLPHPGEPGDNLRQSLGPKLAAEAERVT